MEVLLPALCLCPANLGLVNEVWGILSLQPATDRWAMYAALKVRFCYFVHPLVTLSLHTKLAQALLAVVLCKCIGMPHLHRC